MFRAVLVLFALALPACKEPPDDSGDAQDSGPFSEVRCDDGLDDEGDGWVDCADQDCWGAACPEACDTPGDEDGDGASECADSDCWVAGGGCAEDCAATGDQDGDGLDGCADDDCWGEACAEDCATAGDQDGDGLDGCADPDCWVAGGLCAEDCASGSDEDGDALVGCEDDDCFTYPTCYESDCSNDADEDGDALVDCEDDDCWGRGCEATVVQVTGGGALSRQSGEQSFSSMCDTVPVWMSERTTYRASATAVSGEVEVLTASATAWNTCAWFVSSVTFGSAFGDQTSVLRLPTRRGVTVDPGCGFTSQATSFLPPVLQLDGDVALAYGSDLVGPGLPWYLGASPATSHSTALYSGTWTSTPGTTTGTTTGTATFDSFSCDWRITARRDHLSVPSLAPGGQWIRVQGP